ncbi:MAG: complement resistance protein TraT [Planctomycetota bacterium]
MEGRTERPGPATIASALVALVTLALTGCSPDRVDLLWASQVQQLEIVTTPNPTVWVAINDTSGDGHPLVESIEPAVWAAFDERGYAPASSPASADYLVRASVRAVIEDPFTSQEGKNKLLTIGGGAAVGLGVQQAVQSASDDGGGFVGFISGIFAGVFTVLSLDYFFTEREYIMLVDVNIGRRLAEPAEVDQRFAMVKRAVDLNASTGENMTDSVGYNLASTMVGEFDSDKTPGEESYTQTITLHHTQNINTVGVFAKGRQMKREEAYQLMVPKIQRALAGSLPDLTPNRP